MPQGKPTVLYSRKNDLTIILEATIQPFQGLPTSPTRVIGRLPHSNQSHFTIARAWLLRPRKAANILLQREKNNLSITSTCTCCPLQRLPVLAHCCYDKLTIVSMLL
mmetsp:Transcript_623/g.1972  ORF Transcript_623/g.1972 Transcript_623/m.1972 type:complete len:107 (-) Transcript_623:622-942(-)